MPKLIAKSKKVLKHKGSEVRKSK